MQIKRQGKNDKESKSTSQRDSMSEQSNVAVAKTGSVSGDQGNRGGAIATGDPASLLYYPGPTLFKRCAKTSVRESAMAVTPVTKVTAAGALYQ
eukprot:346062-Amphidinium_carterae.1